MLILVLLSILFCHVIADYNLQGWLASAKQKEWWKKNAPDDLYRNDYVMALFMHALSWTFVIFIPIFAYLICTGAVGEAVFMLPMFAANVFFHMGIDHMKANEKVINLVTDQFLHLFQIAVTFVVFLVVCA